MTKNTTRFLDMLFLLDPFAAHESHKGHFDVCATLN